MTLLRILITATFLICFNLNAQDDSYRWLEEVTSEKSLEFVTNQNKITEAKLSAHKEYQNIYNKSLEIYNDSDKIAYPRVYGKYVYNFWKDKNHIRGIWRRSTKISYLNGEPSWETLLDIDEMSKKDTIKWVYKGVSGLYPTYDRFMVYLSNGGGDATVKREFDVNTKKFIENGFNLKESKGSVSFIDENTLLVGIDFGKNTITTSGYPKQKKNGKEGLP